MKKQVVLFVLASVFAFIMSSCKDDSTSPAPGGGTVTNISESEFPTTATGGDPRGTYTPNTPVISIKYSPASESMTLSTTFTKNTGTGSMTLKGSSATSGTYTVSNMKLDIQGKMRLTRNGEVLAEQPFHPADVLDSNKPSGTWKVISGKLYFDDETEGPAYTVTSKGLFFVSDLDFEDLGTGIMSMAMRKQ